MCFAGNMPTDARDTAIPPMGRPSRSRGTATIERNVTARATFRAPYSGSASMSGIWAKARSRSARPIAVLRLGARGKLRSYSAAPAGPSPWWATRRIISPSNRNTAQNWASHSCIARRAIMSNTGCVSVGELLMTFRISPVAVCCWSASVVSLNRRTFSIAITAWSAKVLSRSTFASAKYPGHAGQRKSRR